MMEKKTVHETKRGLYAVLLLLLIQTVVLVGFNTWQEWKLDNFRTSISERGEVLSLLHGACLTQTVDQAQTTFNGSSHIRSRRQGTLLTNFIQQFLATQEKALEAACAGRSDLCIRGPIGVTGDKGNIGPSGVNGGHGTAGEKGNHGSIGLNGVKGDTGFKGAKGLAGSNGIIGMKGARGNKGQSGLLGPKGDIGQRGEPGVPGTKGDAGTAGLKGGLGSKGAPGAAGQKGDPGLPGISGTKGDRGVSGASGTVLHSECVCLDQYQLFGNYTRVINIPFGHPLSLHCEFNKLGIPITWSKDGGGSISQRGVVHGGDLNFQQVLTGDAGTYHCRGPKGVLEYLSKDVTVVVGKPSPYDCDFETSCSWKDATDDKRQWTRHSGHTVSTGTGPSFDHTLQNGLGHYIYLETSSPAAPGDDAKLVSPLLPAGHVYCLTFWYHMYGATMGILEVKLKAGARTGVTIWSKHGNQGSAWHLAKVNISSQTSGFNLVMRAIRGASYTSDIALDDIILLNGSCQ